MPITIKCSPASKDVWHVFSGPVRVGVLINHSPQDNASDKPWEWHRHFENNSPIPHSGRAASRDDALAGFQSKWEELLALMGLHERQHGG